MGTIINLAFSAIKFLFKSVFWIIGAVIVLMVGSCPD